MELTPLLMYESFLLAIGVAAVCSFAFFYFRLLKGYNKLHQEYSKLHQGLDEYGRLLSTESKQHLQQLVAHSQELSDQLKQELAKLLDLQAQKESGAYQAIVEGVGKNLEAQSKMQVKAFADNLSKDLEESETEVRAKIAMLYDSAQVEVEKIKADARQEAERMKAAAIDDLREHIYPIVEEVVRESTGKLLSQQDSEGIVLEALEKSLRSAGIEKV